MTRIFKSPRTMQEEPELQIDRFPELRSRPDIYPGTPEPSMSRLSISGPTGQRNRRVVRRRVSPFTVVILLMCAAVAIVLYISNIIAVDQLLNEVNSLETRHKQILMEQEILKAQINKMAGLERIQELAEKDLGLVTPKEPPGWLDVDRERIKQIEREKAER
jgi:cell division protein FtsL